MNLRASKACDHCRASKKRCRPPLPCQNCVSAGVRCIVREKARYGISRCGSFPSLYSSPYFIPFILCISNLVH
ncbi:hypothetical protein BDV36DRAFT_276828 [Aspergillus pseudocaelatus]|uniref:Zn(2)-C6 fungal-type domain-containing protein n=1 Tax=Aspergillus pseudocaelatus TaxID=1825620 RepID=A0ABQ6W0U9_9EURO|nr:hypothetical protein BDV36DRAFT_276828 [Aspergillus pseudocaelatus]